MENYTSKVIIGYINDYEPLKHNQLVYTENFIFVYNSYKIRYNCNHKRSNKNTLKKLHTSLIIKANLWFAILCLNASPKFHKPHEINDKINENILK